MTGVCVGVDAGSRFLSVGLPHTLRSRRLGPNEVLSKCMNLLGNSFVDHVREIAGALRTYDHILANHLLITASADECADTLHTMRALFFRKGLIIVNMSTRFTPNLFATNDSTPMQFRAWRRF